MKTVNILNFLYLIYINSFFNLVNNNLHQLIDKKQELIEENKELKQELLKYDNVVTLINHPELYRTSSVLDNKKLFLPIILVFLYVLFFIIRNIYLKGKEYSESKQA